MNEDQLKHAEELASRPYQVELQAYKTPDGQTYFFGRVPEMPGCVSDGDTEQEAKANVKSALIDFIYFLLEDGLSVPEPRIFDSCTTINMSEIPESSAIKREKAYRSLDLDIGYGGQGATASLVERRVYVA